MNLKLKALNIVVNTPVSYLGGLWLKNVHFVRFKVLTARV
jgi:hypothetical protein